MNDITQFTMRLNNSLYDTVKKSADMNKRSIAKELEFAIEEHYLRVSHLEIPNTLADAIAEFIQKTNK